ncbi:hypothetical protein BDZ94DRAFT_1247081 [Collybia nuda]|uniref:Uncharacterized protein n=1 Tax=Collybia nuda TaxID=64659 RepID=A0A9P5YFS7_9AGAR|nr:hypothetical protein BDZ94DRAFT_1247081 [Collybia nuda]
MLSKANFGFIVLSALSASQQVLAREKWLERDNRPVYLYPRRFGQEQPAVIQKISAACPGQVCGNLAGQAVTPLLAAQPECSQQDHADAIIDASKQFDAATQANMIALAVEYRQVEKNTPPDFTTNPPSLRNSVFCQKAPKNPELNGLVQAQDPANDPNLFFDPALKATVQKGSQANTAPFGGAAAPPPAVPTPSSPAVTPTATPERAVDATSCVTAITVTVTGNNPAATGGITITAGDLNPPATAVPVPTGTAPPTNGNIGNFGKCSVPQMEFGVGFDNRRETSFRPVDRVSYNHGSAQNHAIITQFICDTLVNSCGADITARATCATAKTAAASAAAGTGAQADAFNAVFGISTNFASIASVDNQGRVIPGTGNGAGAAPPSITAAPTTASAATPSAPSPPPATGDNTGVGNFGSCSVPKIEFAAGFDGRRETSFQPSDKTSFSQGSAQNIGIITRAICDTLTNSCGADQAAKNTCVTATAAANAAPVGGAQADAFNEVFGIQTNFAAVTRLDDQGRVIGGTSQNNGGGAEVAQTQPPNLVASTTTARQAVTSAPSQPVVTTSIPAAKVPGNSNTSNLQTFTGTLGGVGAPAVTATSDGKFQVEGNSAINDAESAVVRSCDVQNNKCADAANRSGNKDGFTVAACSAQQQECTATARA